MLQKFNGMTLTPRWLLVLSLLSLGFHQRVPYPCQHLAYNPVCLFFRPQIYYYTTSLLRPLIGPSLHLFLLRVSVQFPLYRVQFRPQFQTCIQSHSTLLLIQLFDQLMYPSHLYLHFFDPCVFNCVCKIAFHKLDSPFRRL